VGFITGTPAAQPEAVAFPREHHAGSATRSDSVPIPTVRFIITKTVESRRLQSVRSTWLTHSSGLVQPGPVPTLADGVILAMDREFIRRTKQDFADFARHNVVTMNESAGGEGPLGARGPYFLYVLRSAG